MTQYLVRRANLLVLGVLMTIVALAGAATWERLNASREAREWSQHSYRVLSTTKDLAIAPRDAECGQRVYVLTGRDEYLTPYDAARDRLGLRQVVDGDTSASIQGIDTSCLSQPMFPHTRFA